MPDLPMPDPYAPEPIHGLAYGVPFRVLASTQALRSAILDLLPYGTELTQGQGHAATFLLLAPEPGHGYRCLADEEPTCEHIDAQPVLDQCARDLMVHVADHAPERVFVHAGVVAWRGRAIVLPGPSFAGKTTLTAALVRAGALYYSDEYAVLDATGTIHPYARDLQMRQPGSPRQRSVAVEQLAGNIGTQPIRAAQVVFAKYEAGASWQPEPVTPGRAVLEMLRHTIPVQRTPARVMATLTAMLEGATAWSSRRGEADEAAAALLQSLALR